LGVRATNLRDDDVDLKERRAHPSSVPLFVKTTLHKLSPVQVLEQAPISTEVPICEDINNMVPGSASTLSPGLTAMDTT
jgi:hypothetical protein